jgi:hypothetical protein
MSLVFTLVGIPLVTVSSSLNSPNAFPPHGHIPMGCPDDTLSLWNVLSSHTQDVTFTHSSNYNTLMHTVLKMNVVEPDCITFHTFCTLNAQV